MARTAEQIQADLDGLRAALATSQKSVAFADRSVVNRDIDELLRAIQALEAELATVSSRPRQWAVYSSKGLGT